MVPLAVYKAFAPLSEDAALLAWLPALAGAILIVAGAYQFTGLKRICFDHCQSPFAFVATHDFAGVALMVLGAAVIAWPELLAAIS